MARTLVVYASNYGQTRKIAEHIASRAREAGHEATLLDITDDPGAGLPEADLTVVASAIYTGQHPSMIRWATSHAEALTGRDAVFVSVSMAAAQDDESAEDMMWTYVDDFGADTGWAPKRVVFVAGAVALDRYDAATRALVRVAVWMRGLDASQGELTDWEALDQHIAGWLS